MANGLLCDEGSLARKMAQAAGVELVEISAAYDGTVLVVLGLGTGIVLAACDHLLDCYPDLGIVAADLPGGLGFDNRIRAMDYLGTAFPCLWLLWCSLSPARRYAEALEGRRFQPLATWSYIRGIGSAVAPWERLGVRLVRDLWSDKPLGDWQAVCEILSQGHPSGLVGEVARQC